MLSATLYKGQDTIDDRIELTSERIKRQSQPTQPTVFQHKMDPDNIVSNLDHTQHVDTVLTTSSELGFYLKSRHLGVENHQRIRPTCPICHTVVF